MRRVRPLTTATPTAAAACGLAAAVLLGALQGCAGHGDRGYTLPAEKLRDGEKAQKGRTGRSSDMQFAVVAYTGDIGTILGTHAEMKPKGHFVRIRLLCVNTGRDIQVFDTWAQRLVLTDGRRIGADVNSTMVKRQPERLSVGANMRAEFDLWFDVPKGATAKSVELHGSPAVGMVTDPPPAEIPLPS
ncbi:DUF4352 domain-containing protein [Actinomadura logoneensis]|uniref:DUF4352 domain-containing protein n=1 Tax=Actinomadura logoneensis TaxID=2293572 RepID=A0A372J9Y3_9ACTN|nr:DUF4352 domain-containing protein [Actinomadura logoneensis]RFU36800.1 DUF4352 domain-containing protein [Actinomadura logoneensis]